jgi:HEAT repeat protein
MSERATQKPNRAGHIEQGLALADWLVALSHDSPFEGPNGAGGAGAGPSPPLTAVPSLLFLLQDTSREARLRAVEALGGLAWEARRLLPTLCTALEDAALHDGDDGVRAAAVRAFLRAGPQPATEVGPLIDALHSELDVVRFHAAITLGDFGPRGRAAVPALIHASLWDEEPAVRLGAATALWKIDGKGPLALNVLTEALGSDNELLCWVAAECLGQMGRAAREAAPALRQALRREFRLSLIRAGVKLALERIDPQAATGQA